MLLDMLSVCAGNGSALVATVEGEVVGMCAVNMSVDLALLQANFDLASLLPAGSFPSPSHAELDVFVMNPIFVHRAGAFLAGENPSAPIVPCPGV